MPQPAFSVRPGLVNLVQNVVHRIVDRARHGAVDRRCLRLVLLRAGVGRDAAGRNRTAAQRPEESLVPVLLFFRRRLGVGERLGDALVGVIDRRVDRIALLGLQAVLLVPDVLRSWLQRNLRRATCNLLKAHCAHLFSASRRGVLFGPAISLCPRPFADIHGKKGTLRRPANRPLGACDSTDL